VGVDKHIIIFLANEQIHTSIEKTFPFNSL
jgi:hypothetical protein